MSARWPDGTPRSQGNGFDLQARIARGPSIFCNLTTKQAAAGSQGGVLSASTVATVKGLSPRGQQLVKPRVFGKVTPSQERK